MFFKNWKKIRQGWQRFSGAGQEASRTSRRKDRQSLAKRNAFRLSPRIEPLEQRTLLAVWSFPADATSIPQGAALWDTSTYAMGTMTWNIIFVSTTPEMAGAEVWTEEEMNAVKSDVDAGAALWETKTASLVPGARISITPKYLTDYGYEKDDVNINAFALPDAQMTPSGYPLQPEKQGWINETLAWIHFDIGGEITNLDDPNTGVNVMNFNNQTRYLNGTNWSGTIFFIHDANDNLNDPYPNTPGSIDYDWAGKYREYAYAGGGSSVITQSMTGAVAHEMGHLMGALDEYLTSGAKYTDFSGSYLVYQNFNCVAEPAGTRRISDDEANWPDSLYLGGSFIDPCTERHVGIWDSDYDHIPDILDMPPTIDGNVADSNPGEGTLLLTGSLGVTAFPNQANPGHDITINTVAAGYYRINGGEQIPLAPDDGVYDGYTETFNLRLDHLFRGTYSIDVYVVNSVGRSASKHFEFASTLTPPDLTITKSHAIDFTQGKQNESYSITVSNAGADGSPTYGKVTVVDMLPAGLTFSNYIGVGWTLDPTTTPSRPVFIRTDVLDKNSTYPTITLFVNVALDPSHTTKYTVVNTAIVSGGGDSNVINNTFNDPTIILPPADLTISKTHTGTFHRGSWSGNTYTVTVTNAGTGGSTIGRVYVEDIMPEGLTGAFSTANGWSVDNSDPSHPRAYRDETLLYGSNFPALLLDVTVSRLADTSVTNTVIVSGGGEVNTSNNTATDVTEILPLPDLAIAKSHIGNFTQGDVGRTYMIIVSNANSGITDSPVIVTETLPPGLRIRSMSGTGWSVNLSTMTATNSNVLNGVASYSPLYVTVDVDFNAPAVVYNTVTVSGGGEETNANNTADFTNNTVRDETLINVFMPLQSTGYVYAGTASLTVNFNRTVLGAGNVANFELRNCGADGLLGNADDAILPMTASYYNGTTTLNFPGLMEGVYRLTIRDAITDASGVKIDGNSDGVPGGDWVMDFVVVPGANLLAPATTFGSVGTKPMGIAKGDFNGDGKLDLALANAGSGTTQILLGSGNAAFTVGQTLLAETAAVPCEVTAADFNADGKLDLAVVNYDSLNLNGTLKIYLGVGNGTFASGNTYTWANISPKAVVAADLNGDGKLDLAVANYNSGKVTTLFGDGAGAFGNITNYNAGGANPAGVVVGDFNGDGRNDLAVANNDNGTVGIFLNSGNGMYPGTAATYLAGGTHSRGLAVGDFNLDGSLDIAVANFGAVGGSDGGVGILLNFGNGTFPASNIPYFAGGTHPNGIDVVDMNGDGRLDLVVTNSDSGTVGVLTRKTHEEDLANSGLFNESITYGTFIANGPYDMIVGDYNADGKPDVAVTNSNTAGTSNSVTIMANVFGTPTPPAQQTTPYALNSPHYLFDVSVSAYGPGQFINGTNNAFDGYGRLMVGGSLFRPMSGYTEADGKQTIVSPTATISGLSVYRRVTVPNTGNEDFARTVDTFTNPTGSPITATVRIVSNLGSDAATTIFTTSSGDTTLTTGDLWFGTDRGSGNVLIHCLRSQYGLAPTAVERVGDNLAWTYVITVPAGQSVELGYFTIQAANRAAGISAVGELVGANGFGGQAALGLSQADLNALANFQFPKPMNVLASDLPAAGNVNMTLKLGTDGKIHLYQTGTSIDLVAPRPYGAATALNIIGRNSFGEALTIDLSGGNPIPAGGMTFNGGTGGGNSIVIAGTSADDAVTMTASQIILNGSTINYANATVSSFQLGGGVNTLTLDHVALSLSQNNAISAGTKVTLDGGTLNYNGYAQNLGDLTLTNGGSVNAGAIDNPASTVSVGSGSTLTATSIVCDSLVIGSSGGAAAGASANLTVNDGQHVNIASFNNPAATIDVQSGGTLTATSIVCDTLAIGSPSASAAAASSAPAMAATPEETASADDAAVPTAIAPTAVTYQAEELTATAIVSAPAPMLSVISTLAAEKPSTTSLPVSSPLARAAIFAADAKESAKPASWIQSPRWEMPELAAAAAQVRSATVNRALESMFSDDEDPFQPPTIGKIKRRR